MSKENQAFAKSIKYLGYKMRTEKEVRDYLLRKNFSKAEVEETIEKLLDYNLINDEEYAIYWIRDRFNYFNQGRYRISYDLFKKGIKKEIIQSKLQEFFSDEKEEEKIKYLFLKKYPNDKKISEKELYTIYKYIIRKGFPSSKTKSVIFGKHDFDDS